MGRLLCCRRPPLSWVVLLLTLLGQLPQSSAAKIDEEPELAVEQVKQEAALEVKFARLKANYGIQDRRTLDVFFSLFDLWIMLYRLNKADAALKEVLPVCEWRRDDLAIKAVQALAFTRWKQGKYRDALARFHEMEGWMGKNPALCENIGHTYNTLGAYDHAERYFKDAFQLTQSSSRSADHNEGGILLGLAGVQERRGAHQDSLGTALRSYDFYKNRDIQRGWGSSLTAKAAMQVSKIYLHLGSLKEAEAKAREALLLFQETAGDDSPLCAGAFERLANVLLQQGRKSEAQVALLGAYKIEASKDAFNLVEIMEVHNQLVDSHIRGGGLDRPAFKRYFEVVDQVTARVRAELPQDGNAGVYYKLAGEIHVLGDDCKIGRPLLVEAARLFAGETVVDTTHLSKQCSDLVAFCDGTLTAEASS